MKKINKKQIAWSKNKSDNYIASKMKKLLFSTIFVIVAIFTISYLCNPCDNTLSDLLFSGGISTATIMGTVGNIDLLGNKFGVGKQIKAKLWIISEDQWDESQGFPAKIDGERANIPLLNGEYWHYIKSVYMSPDMKSTGELGDMAATINNELIFNIRGSNKTIRSFLETGVGAGFFVVVEICSTGEKTLLGSGCKPSVLSNFDGGPGKDQTGYVVTFKQESPELPCIYTGNTPAEAAEVVAADATTIGLVANSRYQLTTGSVSIVNITDFTAVTDSDVNRIVTILGSGGTYPSTITSGNAFELIGGETWSALANKQISFKIFKNAGADYAFIEVNGSRT